MHKLVRYPVYAAALLVGFASLPAAQAQEDQLRIAYIGGTTSIDPHFHSDTSNLAISRAVFDGLVNPDENTRPIPGLAESWEIIDPRTWEFTLREATFHDGMPVTSDDVAFSFERGMDVEDSPSGGFRRVLQDKTVKVVSDRVFRIETEEPAPTLLEDLSNFAIVSRKHSEGATREDFNAGRVTIGTGPYKFVEWIPGDRVVLERFDDYWGEKPDFARVVMRPFESGPTRVAALLSGDVDAIDQVPTTDQAMLRENPDIHVAQTPSKRIMYIHMDSYREETPHVTAHDGSAIDNPLRDNRVRWALALAIDRPSIAEFVMEGAAVPAGQYAPLGMEGASETLEPIPFDPDRAKALLAEAGYPDGFKLTFHSTGQRYPNDVQLAEAISQMWSRIGVDTTLETMPGAVFFRRGSTGGPDGTPEFSVMMAGCCASPGGAITPLNVLMGTRDPDSGRGSANRGRYSNPELDELIGQALTEMDDVKRDAIIQRASEVAVADMAVIPVHFLLNTWASRGDVVWQATLDDTTVPTRATKK